MAARGKLELASDGEPTAGREIAVRHRAVRPSVAVDRPRKSGPARSRRAPPALGHTLNVLLRLRIGRDPTVSVHGSLARVVGGDGKRHVARVPIPQIARGANVSLQFLPRVERIA